MACCRSSIYKICEPVSACDPWVLRNFLTVLPEGNYVGVLRFLGASKEFDITVEDGEVRFENGLELNEKYTYGLELYSVDEDNEKTATSITVDETEYDIIIFPTCP